MPSRKFNIYPSSNKRQRTFWNTGTQHRTLIKRTGEIRVAKNNAAQTRHQNRKAIAGRTTEKAIRRVAYAKYGLSMRAVARFLF